MKEQIIHCVLLRHGMTGGNRFRKYLGRSTDEPLCEEGIAGLLALKEKGMYPPPGKLLSSPMLRCLQTARILTGRIPEPVSGLEEIDFGRFEGLTWQELSKDPEYCAWLESGGTLPFPGGESREEFIQRTMKAFTRSILTAAAEHTERVSVFCHGGSIMAILSELTGEDYWSFRPEYGEGYEMLLRINEETIDVISYLRVPVGDPA